MASVLEPSLLQDTWVWVAKAQGYATSQINPQLLVDRPFVMKRPTTWPASFTSMIYKVGSVFISHLDTEKTAGMFEDEG